jgi:hypothetical protein
MALPDVTIGRYGGWHLISEKWRSKFQIIDKNKAMRQEPLVKEAAKEAAKRMTCKGRGASCRRKR